jgi:hypothetical protein
MNACQIGVRARKKYQNVDNAACRIRLPVRTCKTLLTMSSVTMFCTATMSTRCSVRSADHDQHPRLKFTDKQPDQ